MFHEEGVRQPTLTSHELVQSGPRRGKQHFTVKPIRPERQERSERPQHSQRPNRSKPRQPRKPQGFDHDQLLKAYKGVMLKFLLSTSEFPINARLIDADRYTLYVDGGAGNMLIFKSAIDAIEFPTPEA